MSKIPEVKLNTWKNLYAAALRFKDLKPWDVFEDTDLFGIRNPETGGTGYACILGRLGAVLALCVYRGTEGLDVYLKTINGEISPDDEDLIAKQNCLMAEFTDRQYLEKANKNVARKLGFVFRGAKSWPLFRSYLPGHVPWHLNDSEAGFLTVALECGCEVTASARRRALNLNSKPGQCLVYVPKPGPADSDAPTAFETCWEPLPVHRPQPSASYALDSAKADKIGSSNMPTDSPWEADVSSLPAAIMDRDRPYSPQMVMVAHQDSGFILNASVIGSDCAPHQALGDAILDSILQHGSIPGEIYFKNEPMIALLSPISKALGISFKSRKRLQAILNARRGFMSMTRGKQF